MGLLSTKNRGSLTADIREQLIIQSLRMRPMTRPELVVSCGLPRSTVFDACRRLLNSGRINTYSEKRSVAGRPRVYYILNSDGISSQEAILRTEEPVKLKN